MRSIPSVPQQILRAALLGPLAVALQHARLAHSRGEWNLIDTSITTPGIANVLRDEVSCGRLSLERARTIGEILLCERNSVTFAAALVLIEFWGAEQICEVSRPEREVLELLGMLALEQEELSARELLAAAIMLAA